MKNFEEERKEFNKNLKETRKKITKTFWEDQTKIENDWLDNYVKDIKGKKYRDDARQRNSIIRNSFVCYEGMVNNFVYKEKRNRLPTKLQSQTKNLATRKYGRFNEKTQFTITFR
jgi:hypothetical protein